MPKPGGVSIETVPRHGRGAVQVWFGPGGEDFIPEELEKRELWDERLVLGGWWLYRSDLAMGDKKDERTEIRLGP